MHGLVRLGEQRANRGACERKSEGDREEQRAKERENESELNIDMFEVRTSRRIDAVRLRFCGASRRCRHNGADDGLCERQGCFVPESVWCYTCLYIYARV